MKNEVGRCLHQDPILKDRDMDSSSDSRILAADSVSMKVVRLGFQKRENRLSSRSRGYDSARTDPTFAE